MGFRERKLETKKCKNKSAEEQISLPSRIVDGVERKKKNKKLLRCTISAMGDTCDRRGMSVNVEGITWLLPGDVPFGRRGIRCSEKHLATV